MTYVNLHNLPPDCHMYTVYLLWPEDGEAEEFDTVMNCHRSLRDMLATVRVQAEDDYLPGFKVVGLIDQSTNRVLYNPSNYATTTGFHV